MKKYLIKQQKTLKNYLKYNRIFKTNYNCGSFRGIFKKLQFPMAKGMGITKVYLDKLKFIELNYKKLNNLKTY